MSSSSDSFMVFKMHFCMHHGERFMKVIKEYSSWENCLLRCVNYSMFSSHYHIDIITSRKLRRRHLVFTRTCLEKAALSKTKLGLIKTDGMASLSLKGWILTLSAKEKTREKSRRRPLSLERVQISGCCKISRLRTRLRLDSCPSFAHSSLSQICSLFTAQWKVWFHDLKAFLCIGGLALQKGG